MPANSPALTAVLGGTFDPIHLGHLAIANTICLHFPIAKFYFLPCGKPVHKPSPHASTIQRTTMIESAIANNPLFEIDTRELDSTQPNYTVTTLASLAKEISTPLAWILGDDVLANLPNWHQWTRLLEYAHFIVVHRPNTTLTMTEPLASWIKAHVVETPDVLLQNKYGALYFQSMPPHAIAASDIQQKIKQGQDVSSLLPTPVWDYIQQHQLYQEYS